MRNITRDKEQHSEKVVTYNNYMWIWMLIEIIIRLDIDL